MGLAGFAIKYRPIVITLVILLLLWGLYSVNNMPRREDPEYTVRTCAVTTSWPGTPAQIMEELITDPLEEAIDRIDDVDIVRSTTKVGLSTIYVDALDHVTPYTIDNVWDQVRANVGRVRMPEPSIVPDVNDEFGDTYIIYFAVYQTPRPGDDAIREEYRYSLRQLDIISDQIRDELRLLPGVARSEQYGVVNEAIFVETDMGTWSQLKLTTDQLQQLVEARNILAPGGSIDTEVGQFSVKPGGELSAVAEMDAIIAGQAGTSGSPGDQRPVYLQDLGLNIVRDFEDPRQIICRYGDAHTSQPAVMVALTMKSGGNIIDVCNAAKDRVHELQEVEQSLPPDIAVVPVSDQSVNVQGKINDVVGNVIGAIVIVIIVVYLVVGFRSASVMAANIPVVVLAAVALITLFDVQLEQISLASIIIALGLLVDNAVQVCDQSRSNQIAGMDPVDATVTGSTQLSSPMLMGTLTTIAAFLPMAFALEGNTQEYVVSLPITLTCTLGISWILAMTLCTVLAASFIRAPKDPSKPSAPLPWLFAKLQSKGGKQNVADDAGGDTVDRVFRMVVRTAINFKFVTFGIAIALLVGALMLPIGSEFFPQDVRDQFGVDIWLPETATIQQTDQVARQVESILRKLSPVTDEAGNPVLDEDGKPLQQLRAMRTMVGGGGARWYLSWDPEPRKPNYAEMLIRTTDGLYTPGLAKRLREICEKGDELLGIEPIVGARVVPQELFLGPGADPVEIRVSGTGFADMKSLRGFANRVKDMVRNYPGTWDVNDSWGISGYQIDIDVDEDKANVAGVSNAAIAQTLNAYFSGHHLTTFREGDHLVPTYLRLTPEERGSLYGLKTAFVEGLYGKVPLDSVGEVNPRWAPAVIERRDLNRVIEIRSQVEPGVRGNDVVLSIMASDEMKQLQQDLPSGFWVEVGGMLEESNDSAEQLSLSLSISVLSIVVLLVIQYNGWAKPVIILATLPLALIGALPGLWITGNPLGFMPQLGILALFGIVLNTGIIFMEFADMLIKDAAEKTDGSGPICGLTVSEFRGCLVEAGKQRLLPIFLTTATTVGGLLPLALAGGPLWEGMAWAMIFGLMIATLLTLLVVPALYAIFVEHLRVKPFR